MREIRINDGLEETVTATRGVIPWEDEEAKAKHNEHIALFYEAKRKRDALAVNVVEGGN